MTGIGDADLGQRSSTPTPALTRETGFPLVSAGLSWVSVLWVPERACFISD